MEKVDLNTNEDYKIQVACKQVSAILDCYNEELLKNVVPQELLDNLKNNSANDYEYVVDPYNFDPSTLTEESLELLLIIFHDYFADDVQKQKINSYFNPINNEKYNPDELFKPIKLNEDEIIDSQLNNQLVVYSESNIFKKILLKLKSFFMR